MRSDIQKQKWFEVDGDNTLALDWPLNEDSHVWEIGGFEGRWVQQIWDKYHCNITIFEPQAWAVKRMRERFKGIEKIDIRPYGLWTHDDTLAISNFETDGASVVANHPDKPIGLGQFRDFRQEIDHDVDVCLMNIEGGEYTLIPEFIKSGKIQKFENFWCQFHPGLLKIPEELIREQIFSEMEETHFMLWNCFPTAVAWRKR